MAAQESGPMPASPKPRAQLAVAVVAAASALVPALAIAALVGPGATARGPVSDPGVEPCQVTHRKAADPGAVLLGDSVAITLAVDAPCQGQHPPLRLVLTLDNSRSMAAAWQRDLSQAARELVAALDLPAHPTWSVGVVVFNTVGRTLCPLTNDEGHINGCLRRMAAAGGTRIDLGIAEALRVLRRVHTPPEDGTEIFLVASDGVNNAGCPPVLQAAQTAKSQGVILITACLGRDCDTDCMSQAATSPRYYYEAAGSAELRGAFAAITTIITQTAAPAGLKDVEIDDEVPANMEYVPAPGAPPPAWDPGTRRLTWPSAPVPAAGITYSYRLRPLEVGDWPANVRAGGRFTDTWGRTGTFTFTVPQVLVLSPPATPTEAATAVPTPSPTPRPHRAFLPVNKTSR